VAGNKIGICPVDQSPLNVEWLCINWIIEPNYHFETILITIWF
jgi:hypothetical protein